LDGIHGWESVDVVVEEWTSPADGRKELFFRNQFSYYKDHFEGVVMKGVGVMDLPGLIKGMGIMMGFMDYMDGYMLIGGVGWGEDGKAVWWARWLTHGVEGTMKFLGKLMSWRWWWEEYTPEALRVVVREIAEGKEVGKSS
jgi:hypothetical protein